MDSPESWADLAADEVLLKLRLSGDGSASGFLDTHQYAPLLKDAGVQTNGGYPQAQFRRVSLGTAAGVKCWALSGAVLPEVVKVPRQLRSWLYREGAPPDSIGDVHFGNHAALATTSQLDLADFFTGAKETSEWSPPEPKLERVTAAALRIDSVVAELFRVSRSEAQTAVEYGFIFLNFQPVTKRTTLVKPGDQLVYRTKGRGEVVSADDATRSGRTVVTFCRFPS